MSETCGLAMYVHTCVCVYMVRRTSCWRSEAKRKAQHSSAVVVVHLIQKLVSSARSVQQVADNVSTRMHAN